MTNGNKRVLRSRDAEADLISIWQFGANEWSPELAGKHLREIEDICDRLLDEPGLGRKRDELIPGIRSILVRPHAVFYTRVPMGIYIVRVLHQRLDVEMVFREP